MAMPQAAGTRPAPTVEHEFDGDVKVLHGSFARRQEIRGSLTELLADIEKSEDQPAQVSADITIRVGGKEHIYSVKVCSPSFEAPSSGPNNVNSTVNTRPDGGTSSAGSPDSSRANGKRRISLADGDDDDVVEISSFKRPRQSSGRGDASKEPKAPASIDELTKLVLEWRKDWLTQGGWLFDALNAAAKQQGQGHLALLQKSDNVQETLGQALNASASSTITEFGNMAKLFQWLENCRKISADKVQEREEKWRNSSANFHDMSRRDRESSEKRIEAELQSQRQLLLKIAKAGGVTVEPSGGDPDEDPLNFERCREESLGAQLTAELAVEAYRSKRVKARETTEVEDDE